MKNVQKIYFYYDPKTGEILEDRKARKIDWPHYLLFTDSRNRFEETGAKEQICYKDPRNYNLFYDEELTVPVIFHPIKHVDYY